ncbi:MBL fold metallo-hydrolase [Chitinophaga nivalis]|uniref:MBL fold metallo-hydrolase n=1 Tax=Chitinophaga nivalis TaxID=2991709 RepID=A0ABT3IKA2_9BACT|nr:MBL fold metallo-hydrolase [Chitinophaga nivalis]MCW3465914.1 MBL fold metallo-hydrolase [Chitinophaga nivalis]MCW3484395.1 MBL fold metallo-hydrolase [Chitinophaga nivalis]
MTVKTFHTSRFFIKNQCYLIHENNTGILIDPAWNYKLINRYLQDNQITLAGILLTHSHIDHSHLAEKFARQYRVPVFLSGIETDHFQFDCINLQRVLHMQEISLAGFNITPILTPGHTPGSVCYLIDQHLFSGDSIFIEGVGICAGKDIYKLYNTIQFMKQYLHKDTLFWPGHSFTEQPGKDMDFLLRHNIYFQLKSKEHFLNFRMKTNGSPLKIWWYDITYGIITFLTTGKFPHAGLFKS